MPRGRPRTIVSEKSDFFTTKIDVNDAELIIAGYLDRICGIPGCMPKLHFQDARRIVELLSYDDFKIVKDGN